jgi:hypothetical protein
MCRIPISRFLNLLFLLVLTTLACKATDIYSDTTVDILESEFPDLLYSNEAHQDPGVDQDPVVDQDPGPPQNASRWDIQQCNAISQVTFALSELEEYQDEDGETECHYGYEISNLNGVRIIYHKYIFGNNDIGNEEGWITKGFTPNLTSYTLRSSIYNCPQCITVRSERVTLTIAVIYDRPECAWITDGGIHFDILQITEEEPLICPCTNLYPEHIPDISEGLIRN